jgi:hypothetical protein
LGVANVATLPDLAGKNMAAIMQNPYRWSQEPPWKQLEPWKRVCKMATLGSISVFLRGFNHFVEQLGGLITRWGLISGNLPWQLIVSSSIYLFSIHLPVYIDKKGYIDRPIALQIDRQKNCFLPHHELRFPRFRFPSMFGVDTP